VTDRVKIEESFRKEVEQLLERMPRLSDMQLSALITVLRAAQPEKNSGRLM